MDHAGGRVNYSAGTGNPLRFIFRKAATRSISSATGTTGNARRPGDTSTAEEKKKELVAPYPLRPSGTSLIFRENGGGLALGDVLFLLPQFLHFSTDVK